MIRTLHNWTAKRSGALITVTGTEGEDGRLVRVAVESIAAEHGGVTAFDLGGIKIALALTPELAS